MRVWLLGLMLTVGLVVPWHAGEAQVRGKRAKGKKARQSGKKKKKGEGKSDDVPKPKSAFGELEVQLPTLERVTDDRARMRLQMREWLVLVKKKRYKKAQEVRKQLMELRWNLGLENVTVFAGMLIREAERAPSAAKAQEWLKAAAAFAPAMTEPHYRMAWLIVTSNPAKLFVAVKSVVAGVKLHLRDIFGISVIIANTVRYLAWVLGFAFVLFWIFLLFRSLRAFQGDFIELFPDGVTPFQIQLMSLFLIFLPLLMGAGILEAVLCWVVISWFYQKTSERVATTLGLLLLSSAPYVADWTGKLVSLSRAPVASVYALNETDLDTQELRNVQALAQQRPKDAVLHWSLGLYYKRNGMLEEAKSAFERAYKSSREAALLINLGNLAFLQQRAEDAYNLYRRALRKRGLPSGQYNLSVLYKHSTSTSQDAVQLKVSALSAARAGGGEKIETFIRRTKTQLNRYILDARVPFRYYRSQVLALSDETGLARRLWAAFVTWIPLAFAPFVGIGMVLFLWLMLPLIGRYFRGVPCYQCGRVIGWREQRAGNKSEQCGQCSQLQNKTEHVSPERRVMKELEIQRYKRRRSSALVFFGLICPGAGHIMLEESGRAFFALFLFGTALFLWLHPGPLLVHPFAQGSMGFFWVAVGLSVLVVLSYIRGVRDVFDRR